jgi:hypothetical protein
VVEAETAAVALMAAEARATAVARMAAEEETAEA